MPAESTSVSPVSASPFCAELLVLFVVCSPGDFDEAIAAVESSTSKRQSPSAGAGQLDGSGKIVVRVQAKRRQQNRKRIRER